MIKQSTKVGDLDRFVAEIDRCGGIRSEAAKGLLCDFVYETSIPFDQSLDPYSEAYFGLQRRLYEEISGRPLDQAKGELLDFQIGTYAAGVNPYASHDPVFIAEHARTIHSCVVLAALPPGASVLDLGCGWGLSSECLAYAGARVTAVDINPNFVKLVSERARRLNLPIRAVQGSFDEHEDGDSHDAVLFYECLHHSLKPWNTISRAAKVLKPRGKIIFAGEPINSNWWTHWGLRLDPESVYVMRKYGWWESGWSESFIRDCFRRCGMGLSLVAGAGLRSGPVGFAVREEDFSKVRPLIPEALRQATLDRLRIHQLESSMSWRLTAPLRAAAGFFTRSFGRE